MGKKRVYKETGDTVLEEQEKVETAVKKAGEVGAQKRATSGNAYIQASYNNIIITMTDPNGNVIAWSTAGSCGFKGPKKATPYAAARVAEVITEKVRKSGLNEITIFVRGIGAGREAAIRALANQGFHIESIKDITPVPHNGCRPPKARRV